MFCSQRYYILLEWFELAHRCSESTEVVSSIAGPVNSFESRWLKSSQINLTCFGLARCSCESLPPVDREGPVNHNVGGRLHGRHGCGKLDWMVEVTQPPERRLSHEPGGPVHERRGGWEAEPPGSCGRPQRGGGAPGFFPVSGWLRSQPASANWISS
jgi:hypothetical protein